MWYKHSLRNEWRDFRLLMAAFATVAEKRFNRKFTAVYFPIGYFMSPFADADIGSLKPFHTIIDKHW